MKDRDWTVSDLLAHRDGEPLDAKRAAAIASDPEAQATIEQLTALREELRASADVEVDDAVWLSGQDEVPVRSWTLRYPAATAASVFVASTLFIVLLLTDFGSDPAVELVAAPVQTNAGDMRLAGLMSQSRNLEQRLRGGVYPALSAASLNDRSRNPSSAPSREEVQLLYRIADVDAQIARLHESRVVDEFARTQLWQRRVNLLENLVLLHGVENKRQL